MVQKKHPIFLKYNPNTDHSLKCDYKSSTNIPINLDLKVLENNKLQCNLYKKTKTTAGHDGLYFQQPLPPPLSLRSQEIKHQDYN